MTTRLEQLDSLQNLWVNNEPVRIHGSIAHAALMAETLPGEIKFTGDHRDIDVFVSGVGKIALEDEVSAAALHTPSPIDAGLCGLLIHEGNDYFVHKDGIIVELKDGDLLDEVRSYEVSKSNGVVVRSFSPLGMLAVHSLEPQLAHDVRLSHPLADIKLTHWFTRHELQLPKAMQSSIDSFHQAYDEAFPRGKLLNSLAQVYSTLLPEAIRSRLRSRTHRFMRDHAGRNSPYID